MTIEMAPISLTAVPAKLTEVGVGQKSTDKPEIGSAGTAKSFLAALAYAEDAVAPVAIDSSASFIADSAVDWLEATDTTLSQEKPLDSTSGALSAPALLLAQASFAPIPDVTVAADTFRGKAGAVPSKDGALPLQAVVDSALGKPLNAPQTKSGKVVLDAVAQAAQPELVDSSVVNASATAMAAASKEVTPERIHKFVQDLTATLAKAPESSTAALGSNRERSQELQFNPQGPINEVSTQSWVVLQGAGGALGADGVVTATVTTQAEGHYAEQVSYWIGQDVQKAEMTLDGLGANPVEVSISMQGKEATVVFRSDEALTRDSLSNASAQLQDAMSRQGVVLSGVSVGTSNSGDPQRQGSGGKPPGRKVGTVEVVASKPASTVARLGVSGRSIDLFV